MADMERAMTLLNEVKDRLDSLRKSENDPLRKAVAWCTWGSVLGARIHAGEPSGDLDLLRQRLAELSVLNEVVEIAGAASRNPDRLFEAVNRAWRLVGAMELVLSRNAEKNSRGLPILTKQAI